MGEDAAAVDVGDQDHRAVDGLGEAHVGDVAVAQVDLGRDCRRLRRSRSRMRAVSRCQDSSTAAIAPRLVGVVVAGVEVARWPGPG